MGLRREDEARTEKSHIGGRRSGGKSASFNITVNTMEQAAGAPITLSGTVSPANATNKTIVWSVRSAGATGATISGDTLSATATGTVTVTATVINGSTTSANYTKNFTITVSVAPITKYTLTVNSGTGGGSYAEGDAVTVTASVAPSGQRFKELTGTDGLSFIGGTSKASATAKFTMPGKAVSVTATYEQIPFAYIAGILAIYIRKRKKSTK